MKNEKTKQGTFPTENNPPHQEKYENTSGMVTNACPGSSVNGGAIPNLLQKIPTEHSRSMFMFESTSGSQKE